MSVRLHINVDHVATLRQARGTRYPDPVHAAVVCEQAGADGITVHLREDRRHIQDRDVRILRDLVGTLLNLEMAATDEMVAFACELRPDLVTLVPEKREEQTTEGGLDVAANAAELSRVVDRLAQVDVPVSMFIDPTQAQVRASVDVGAQAIELHTGDYADAEPADVDAELARIASAAEHAAETSSSLRVAAGHGLTVRNVVALVREVPRIEELNIGHALIADSVFAGLAETVRTYRDAIVDAEAQREETLG